MQAGFGSAVLEALAPLEPEIPVCRLGLPDRFVEHGSVEEQWREAGIDVASIVDAATRQLDAQPPSRWKRPLRAGGADA